MAFHAEDALCSSRITKVLNLPLAVPASKTARAESLIAGEDGQVFDLVAASIAAVCAVVADQGAVAEEEEIGI